MHASHVDRIQEMCIGLLRSTMIPPHRQPNRSKSYCVLVGSIEVLFFEGAGDVRSRLALQAYGGVHPFVLRFDASQWHTVNATSDWAVYLEVIEGPHDANTTQWLNDPPSLGYAGHPAP
jgi:cupin fold WbuC family metalloprotein